MKTLSNNSLLLTAPGRLEWVTEVLPPLQPHEVLIRTTAGAISIGSELPIYCGTARSTEPIHYPRMTGYESIGIISSCGSHVQRFQVGDRVIAFYGHRTHAIIPEAKAIAVPNHVSDELALLSILSCDVSKGIQKGAPKVNESVLITGAGTIGLLTIWMLKAFGVTSVDVVEPHANRRTFALQLGARIAMPPQEIISRNDKYAVAFECSSRNQAFELLQAKMLHGGQICILSDGNVEPLIVTPAFHEKELVLIGSSDGLEYQKHAKWFFHLANENSNNLALLFDYQTTAAYLIRTFELLATGAIMPIKVFVRYNADNTQA